MTTPAPRTPDTPDTSNLNTLLDTISKADTGDARALERLRAEFREKPDLAESLSGLAYNAEVAILSGVPAGAAELFRAQTRTLRRELAREGMETALETMLIRRVVLDYMASLQADFVKGLAPGQSRPLELSRFYDQQADRAHRRLLASVESLARVRKLITPIQINIAEQQVNVAAEVRAGRI